MDEKKVTDYVKASILMIQWAMRVSKMMRVCMRSFQ